MKNSTRHGLVFAVTISVVFTVIVVFGVLSVSAAEIEKVKPEDLKKLIDGSDPNIVVVDTQPKGAYDLGHIKSAINFPWAPEIKSPGGLPRNKTLILYCDCAHEEDSTDVAEQLMKKFGYRNIKILERGWAKWQQSGYPVEKK